VLGGQEDDEEFLHNPLNVYNLIRHVAVGWSVVENTLKQEKQERSGQLSKRVKKALNRLVASFLIETLFQKNLIAVRVP